MVLRNLSFVMTVTIVVSACVSSTPSETADNNGGGGSLPLSDEGTPPSAGPQNPPLETDPTEVFAISELFLGDTDRSSVVSDQAWKLYGYDIDGKDSTETSSDLCSPYSTTDPNIPYPDGNYGIDNSFGKNVLPVLSENITTLLDATNLTSVVNESIQSGSFTLIFKVDKLGSESSYNPLSSEFYSGAKMDTAPKWDGTDSWPIGSNSLSDPTDIESAKVQFSDAYLTENTYVTGTPTHLDLSLDLGGISFAIPIEQTVITVVLNQDRSQGTLGMISGVIPTEDLISELTQAIHIATVNQGFSCSSSESMIASLSETIRSASDIMDNGTQVVGTTCNGISIGLGFNAKSIQLGTIETSPESPEDTCL